MIVGEHEPRMSLQLQPQAGPPVKSSPVRQILLALGSSAAGPDFRGRSRLAVRDVAA